MHEPLDAWVKGTYEALERGDGQALRSFLAPGAVWHVTGHHPLAGDHSGWAGIASFANRLVRSADTLKFDLWEVVEARSERSEATDVVVVYRFFARRGEEELARWPATTWPSGAARSPRYGASPWTNQELIGSGAEAAPSAPSLSLAATTPAEQVPHSITEGRACCALRPSRPATYR